MAERTKCIVFMVEVAFYYDKALMARDLMKDLEGKVWMKSKMTVNQRKILGKKGLSAQFEGVLLHHYWITVT